MIRLIWCAGCVLALAAAAAAPARAQRNNELTSEWDVRVGIFMPQKGAARDREGTYWFTAGAEKAVYKIERWAATFSIDYYGSGRIYNVPITVNARGDTNKVRFGAGAGVGISHDLNEGILGFTYNLLLGYMLNEGPNPATVDLRYFYQSTGQTALNGVALTLGYRF